MQKSSLIDKEIYTTICIINETIYLKNNKNDSKMIKTQKNFKHRITSLTLILMIFIIPLVLSLNPGINANNSELPHQINDTNTEFEPQISLPAYSYDWWNKSWEFRVPVEIKAIGSQQDAPVEYFINFTEFF